MKNSNSHPQTKQFSYLGSTAHYPKVLSFTIDYMWLTIRPDFGSRTLKDCLQKLRITACKQLNEIELDIAELDICQITSSCADIPVAYFDVLQKNDKLIIKLGRTFYKNNTIDLDIRYSAGYYSRDGVQKIREPRSGFYFVSSTHSSSSKQAWTQGETLETKYWFPCLEDPQVKFPREIKVIVSENDLIVLSNGELAQKDGNTWTWTEPNPTPSYLTSVVIGKFAQEHQQYTREYDHNGDKQNRSSGVPLSYYWPSEIPKKDAMLTFINTPKIMKFFEGYFGIKYPYKRYSQVAVEDFELGGMENTSCTTLTKYILHNETASIDYTRDIDVISHELAHQWFGDLVTCRDWADIWLNEGFATYCEALYWESVRGFDDFCYKVIKTADEYLEETRTRYERPLVTRIYKHPDDLFDAHSYEKGSCILHMLRRDMGDNDFRKMLYAYLDIYKNQSVETTNFLNIVEDISGKSLHRFFDQWIYGSGHPRLDIEFYLEHDMNKKKIRTTISQIIQQGERPEWKDGGSKKNQGFGVNQGSSDLFEFTLDLELVFSAGGIEKKHITEAVYISERKTEHWFEIPNSASIEWISIDPQFKLLKEIKSIKIINEKNEFQIKEILKNQLRKGKTIIERIDAARALKKHYYEELLMELRATVMNDPFYGVSVEAANTLGSYNEKNNYSKSNRTYNTLVACMCDDYEFSNLHPEIKQAIVRNIGHFRRKDSVDLLSPLLNKQSESYFVRANAATAIGKSMNDGESSVDNSGKENMIYQLKQIVNTTDSFRNVVACGAIDGLKEFFTDNNNYIVDDIANFLIQNTSCEKDYFKRLVATSALAKFLTSGKKNSDGKNTELREIHRKVFHHLLVLLRDKRRKVRINACRALTDSEAKLTMPDPSLLEAVDALINVAKHDLDAYVRREAERCVNKLREWINEWSSKPFNLDIMLREENVSSSCLNK